MTLRPVRCSSWRTRSRCRRRPRYPAHDVGAATGTRPGAPAPVRRRGTRPTRRHRSARCESTPSAPALHGRIRIGQCRTHRHLPPADDREKQRSVPVRAVPTQVASTMPSTGVPVRARAASRAIRCGYGNGSTSASNAMVSALSMTAIVPTTTGPGHGFHRGPAPALRRRPARQPTSAIYDEYRWTGPDARIAAEQDVAHAATAMAAVRPALG